MTDSPSPSRSQVASSSLASLVAAPEAPGFTQSFPPVTLAKVGVLALIFVVMNWWQFQQLSTKMINDSNWTHGFAIPLFSLWLLYSRREELLSARRRVCLWGLPIILLALVGILAGRALTFYLSQVSMIWLLFGLVLYLGGPKLIRVTWLPILFLLLGIPIPDGAYNFVALRLQNFAASVSSGLLEVFGVAVHVTNSKIEVQSISGQWHELVVAEACSGVRSLMAFVALGVAMAWLTDRPWWQRGVMVLSTVPVAILCNVLRVTVTSTMFVIDKPELGQKIMHSFIGIVMLIPALLLFLALGKLLDAFLVDNEDEPPEPAAEVEQ